MWTSTSAVGCVCRERQRVESAPYGAHASVSEGAKAVCAVCECVVVLVRPRGWHRTPRPPRGPRPAPAGRVSEAIKWTGARHGAVKAQGQGDTKGAARETRSWKRTPLDTTIADKTQNEYRKRIYKFGTGRDERPRVHFDSRPFSFLAAGSLSSRPPGGQGGKNRTGPHFRDVRHKIFRPQTT